MRCGTIAAMPADELLYMVPGWVIASVLLATCALAAEAGFRVGCSRKRAGINDEALTTVEGAVIGFLALLIAFTYSLASGRFELRRELVLQEANAIGTAELRARLVPAPHGPRLRELLREFVDVRIDFAAAGVDLARAERGMRETDRLLAAAWDTTSKIVETLPRDPITALLVTAVNEMIDVSGKRLWANRDHVPEAVLILVMLVAVATVGLVGHCVGSKGPRSLWTSLTVPVIVVAFLSMTIDLDRPTRGLIAVSQQSMLDLQASLRPR